MLVGFVQTSPVFGDVRANLAQAEKLIGDSTADLLVLPELFTTGYQFNNREEAYKLAETIPDGPSTAFLSALSRSTNIALIAGIAERDGKNIYNSAVIVSPEEGYLGKYRKAHLFDTEQDIFRAGNLPFTVFNVKGVNVGIMICFDWRFPETARTLALQGADIIAHPSNLVLPHCPQAMITRCLENRVFAITADRVGREGNLTFIGQSQVVDPDGQVLYRASSDKEEIKVLEIDIDKAREKKINTRNDLISGRRSDLYRLS
jgi:predicted amidohydrolase